MDIKTLEPAEVIQRKLRETTRKKEVLNRVKTGQKLRRQYAANSVAKITKRLLERELKKIGIGEAVEIDCVPRNSFYSSSVLSAEIYGKEGGRYGETGFELEFNENNTFEYSIKSSLVENVRLGRGLTKIAKAFSNRDKWVEFILSRAKRTAFFARTDDLYKNSMEKLDNRLSKLTSQLRTVQSLEKMQEGNIVVYGSNLKYARMSAIDKVTEHTVILAPQSGRDSRQYKKTLCSEILCGNARIMTKEEIVTEKLEEEAKENDNL